MRSRPSNGSAHRGQGTGNRRFSAPTAVLRPHDRRRARRLNDWGGWGYPVPARPSIVVPSGGGDPASQGRGRYIVLVPAGRKLHARA
jgi:hypothetical protein